MPAPVFPLWNNSTSTQLNQSLKKIRIIRELEPQYLSNKVMSVLKNGVEVSIHANSITEHFLLVVEKPVRTEIVSEVDALVNGNSAMASSRAVAGNAVG